MSFLEVKDLAVSYGGVKAVKGIDFHLDQGEVVCLLGSNGAGKSSTLRAVCGITPSDGKVLFQGKNLAAFKTRDLAGIGIALVPEGRGIFSRSTVAENLGMGAYCRTDRESKSDLEKVYSLFPRLAERKNQAAGTLSGGEQQMLALGRALMSRPRLLLLDEPSMGLAPIMVQSIFGILKKIAGEGMTIFLVEQNAKLALELSSRAYVLDGGKITLSGPAASLLENPQVRQAYLGH